MKDCVHAMKRVKKLTVSLLAPAVAACVGALVTVLEGEENAGGTVAGDTCPNGDDCSFDSD